MFTYEAYENILRTLQREGYKCCSFKKYAEHKSKRKTAIIRHDIDLDLERGKRIAELEAKIGGDNRYLFCYAVFCIL